MGIFRVTTNVARMRKSHGILATFSVHTAEKYVLTLGRLVLELACEILESAGNRV
jgi:hypothetical protein